MFGGVLDHRQPVGVPQGEVDDRHVETLHRDVGKRLGKGERAELHILVPHANAARHLLAISHVGVTREREVVVVEVEDRPGVLADLTRKIAKAGVNLDLVYVATRNRVVFGSDDLAGLRAVLTPASA